MIDLIETVLSQRPLTPAEQIRQARGLMQSVACATGNDFYQMLFELLDFADTGRPIGDWEAARRALATFKRNHK